MLYYTTMDKKAKLKWIRSGLRLKVKPPKLETPKNIYSRKRKHKPQEE